MPHLRKNCVILTSVVLSQHTRVTDDRQTTYNNRQTLQWENGYQLQKIFSFNIPTWNSAALDESLVLMFNIAGFNGGLSDFPISW